MASVYAGDPELWKSFRDKFTELLQAEVSSTKKLRDILETAICYFTELEADPMALCLLVGFVIPNKQVTLLKTVGRLISEVSVFDYIGSGDSSVLRYLTRMTIDRSQGWPTINRALRLGVYWVLHAKNYVDGCGGDTDAFVLGWNGSMLTRSNMTHHWEQELLWLERASTNILQSLGNASVDDDEFERRLAELCRRLREARDPCR